MSIPALPRGHAYSWVVRSRWLMLLLRGTVDKLHKEA